MRVCATAAKLGLPDTGYISYGEMIDAGRDICTAVTIPILADGDTGYGNAMNVKRTVKGYAATGFASIMIEDQVAPKRCGHTKGKDVVSRNEALQRVRAAVDARDEGADILILARTDARGVLGMDEALERVRLFEEAGADIVFLEAPESIEEMRMHCQAGLSVFVSECTLVILPPCSPPLLASLDSQAHAQSQCTPDICSWCALLSTDTKAGGGLATAPNTPKLANMLEGGKTPVLPPAQLEEIGYKIAAYPLTLLSRAVSAMNEALEDLKYGREVKVACVCASVSMRACMRANTLGRPLLIQRPAHP